MKNNVKIIIAIGLLIMASTPILCMEYGDYNPNRRKTPEEEAIDREYNRRKEERELRSDIYGSEDTHSVRAILHYDRIQDKELLKQYKDFIQPFLTEKYNHTAEQKYAKMINNFLRELKKFGDTIENEEEYQNKKQIIVTEIKRIKNRLEKLLLQKRQLEGYLEITQRYYSPIAIKLTQKLQDILRYFSRKDDLNDELQKYLDNPIFLRDIRNLQQQQPPVLLDAKQEDDGDTSDTSSVDTVIHSTRR